MMTISGLPPGAIKALDSIGIETHADECVLTAENCGAGLAELREQTGFDRFDQGPSAPGGIDSGGY